MLDVEAVELDAVGPGEGAGLEEVLDLVAVDVEGQHPVRRLRHELLAEVGADEAAGADHADRQRLDRPPVQIYPRDAARHAGPTVRSIALELEEESLRRLRLPLPLLAGTRMAGARIDESFGVVRSRSVFAFSPERELEEGMVGRWE